MQNMLVKLFIYGIQLKADSKTMRYFVGKKEDFESFIRRTVDLIYTVLVLRSKAELVSVEVNGSYYLTNQYSLPNSLKELAANGRVWATKDTVRGQKAYADHDMPNENFQYEGREYTGHMLSPDSVQKYFDDFNANQSNDNVLPIFAMSFETPILMDFSCLMAEDGEHFVKFSESGKLGQEVAYFNEVVSPLKSEFTKSYEVESEEVFARWLVMKP